jgi:hypothetical protein
MTSLANLRQLHLIVRALNSVVGLMTSLSKRQELAVSVVVPKLNTTDPRTKTAEFKPFVDSNIQC